MCEINGKIERICHADFMVKDGVLTAGNACNGIRTRNITDVLMISQKLDEVINELYKVDFIEKAG